MAHSSKTPSTLPELLQALCVLLAQLSLLHSAASRPKTKNKTQGQARRGKSQDPRQVDSNLPLDVMSSTAGKKGLGPRCVRCQLWGHHASSCQADTPACGVCAGLHPTSVCLEARQPGVRVTNRKCAVCGRLGHSAANLYCPLGKGARSRRPGLRKPPVSTTSDSPTTLREPGQVISTVTDSNSGHDATQDRESWLSARRTSSASREENGGHIDSHLDPDAEKHASSSTLSTAELGTLPFLQPASSSAGLSSPGSSDMVRSASALSAEVQPCSTPASVEHCDLGNSPDLSGMTSSVFLEWSAEGYHKRRRTDFTPPSSPGTTPEQLTSPPAYHKTKPLPLPKPIPLVKTGTLLSLVQKLAK